MKRRLILGSALFAPLAFIGCMESGAPTGHTDGIPSSAAEFKAEEAFPGRSGVWCEGYYQGLPIKYEVIDGKNVLDGDVVLADSVISSTLSLGKSAGAATNGSRWANRTIPYTIQAGLTNTQRVTDAINNWSYKFTFVPRTNQTDYLTFRQPADAGTCQANAIGRQGNQQFIDLGTDCGTGNTIHEIGHVMGLYHEQSRADRDNWVTINWGNILSGKSGNFNKYSSGFDWQPFDFNSVMMYPPTAFGTTVGGVVQATIVAKDGRTWTGQRSGLSAGDLSTVEKLYPTPGYGCLSSVSLSAYRQDVFAATSSGAIQTAAWDQTIDAAGTYRGWWSIQGGVTAPGGCVDGLSRSTLKLDVFTVGTDGRPYTGAWNQYVSNGAWRGWWAIGSNITVYPGSHIVPVARTPNNLDVFAVGQNGNIYTAAWDQAVDGGNGFRGWWQILGGVSLSGGQPSAITRGANALDVYAIGTDGNVYQASWSGGATWGGWWTLSNPGTPVNQITAIARGQKIDLFAVGFNRNIYTRAWNGSSWTGWSQVSGGVVAAGSRVAAVSRSSTRLDIFAIGTDNLVYTNGKNDGGAWSGWASVLGGGAGSGVQLSASARSSTSMDVFVVGGDNKVWTADFDGSWHGWWRLP